MVPNAFEIGLLDEEGLAEADAIVGILGGDPTQGKWTRGGATNPFELRRLVLESVFQRFGLMVEYQPNCQDSRLQGRTPPWLEGNRLGTFKHPLLRLT